MESGSEGRVCYAARASDQGSDHEIEEKCWSNLGRPPDPLIVLELILLTAGIVSLLVVIGLGPVLLLTDGSNGTAVFVSPFVGLAVLYLACQWLSPHVPSGHIVVVTSVVFGASSAVIAWVKRGPLVAGILKTRIDLAVVGAIGLLNTIVLQLPMIHSGILTLSDLSGDDLFTWSPSAAYMQTHAFANGHPTAYVSPLLWVLPTNVYPGSAGTVDGGLMSVFGLHSYQLVEPFSAVCLALGASAVYLVLRWTLNASWLVATIGLLLVSTNQSRFFTAGFGLTQSTRGTALMMGGLVLFLLAFTRRSIGYAVLAGGVAGVLVGVYMPAFLVLAAATAGGVLILFLPALRKGSRNTVPWASGLAFAAGGLVFGIQNIRWLLFGGGIHAWVLQTSYGPEPFFLKYPFQYLAGTAPTQYLFRSAGVVPFARFSALFWTTWLNDIAIVIGILAVALVIAGAVLLLKEKRYLIGATLLAPILYGVFVFIDNRGGFGSVLSVVYLTPFACIIGTYGIGHIADWIRSWPKPTHARREQSRRYRGGVVALGCVVGLVLLFQTGASAEDQSFYVRQPGMLPQQNLALSHIAVLVPKGSWVLMYSTDGSNGYATLRKTQALVAAASFLPDRNLTVDGLYFSGTFGKSDYSAIKAAYNQNYGYVLHYSDSSIRDPSIPVDYHAVWVFPKDHLVLYKKDPA